MIETREKVTVSHHNTSSAITQRMSASGHEQVVFCQDESTGLRSIIAIHNTTLGPAVGGTRMWMYTSESDALTDVLRLSRGMTYKSALAGLNIGGGKAVIMGDARTQKNEALMRRFGKFVDGLGGRYITAEDVGISTRDMEYVKMETNHVVGLPEYLGGGGDPSPVTAYGVYVAMKAAVKELTGSDSLNGKKVMVQGIGHVGEYLVGHLVKEGAEVKVADIYEDRCKRISDEYKVEVVNVNDVYTQDVDIYAPCALGATVNDETIEQSRCAIICGAANNQLKDESIHGRAVLEKGILYAPDFVVNSGGIINCYWEIIGYNRQAAMAQAEKIFSTTQHIFSKSKDENIPTYLAANKIAEARIEAIGKTKLPYQNLQ